MKKRIVEISIVIAVIALVAGLYRPDSSPASKLIGVWQTEVEDRAVNLEFRNDGTLTASFGKEVHDAQYSVAQGAQWAHLDVLSEGEEPVQTIFKFVDEDTVVICDGTPGDPRPTDFSGRTLTFTRHR